MVSSHGSSSEDIDEPWIAAAWYRSADGCRAADAAQLQCPCERKLYEVSVHLLPMPNASVAIVDFEFQRSGFDLSRTTLCGSACC